MILDLNKVKIYVRPGRTDMRKQIDGLAAIVQQSMKFNPFDGSLYLFAGKNNKRLKILYWDKNGFCLWQKRLEKDHFPWPKDEGKITHVGCWAHVRRKFNDAEKASGSEVNRDALGRIKKLYQLDNEYRGTDQEKRKEIVGNYLKELKKWLEDKSNNTAPSGATGKALSYTLGQWSKLVKFIDHEELTPDNNGAENAIRPFVVGRKNWLFCGNDKGAEASSRIYSLIETAKMNNLEPYAYLKMLLEKLPSVRNTENWESLLPWNITLA